MNLRNIILIFLAARFPAAYSAVNIRNCVLRTRLLQNRPTVDEVTNELYVLRNIEMGRLVEVHTDKVNQDAFWQATKEGVELWTQEGRTMVEF